MDDNISRLDAVARAVRDADWAQAQDAADEAEAEWAKATAIEDAEWRKLALS